MIDLYQRIRRAHGTLRGDLAFANDWEFFTLEPERDLEQLITTGRYAGTLQAFTAGVSLRLINRPARTNLTEHVKYLHIRRQAQVSAHDTVGKLEAHRAGPYEMRS